MTWLFNSAQERTADWTLDRVDPAAAQRQSR